MFDGTATKTKTIPPATFHHQIGNSKIAPRSLTNCYFTSDGKVEIIACRARKKTAGSLFPGANLYALLCAPLS
jgi:hypothetical protein